MKRLFTVAIALMLSATFSQQLSAQTFGAPEFMKGKLVVGGDFDAGYYSNSLCLGIAPQVGFRLTRSLEVGVRLGYNLNYFPNYGYGRYFYHGFSGAGYANFEIFRGFYLHAEDEELCLLVRGKNIEPSAPSWFNSVFVGGGYRQYLSSTSYYYYALLYDLSFDYYHNTSPYASPLIIRMGFCFAL